MSRDRFPVDEAKFDRFIAFASGYTRWLRFHVSGLEHVPADGPALLIGNHAGLRLHDGWATAVALRRRHPARRIVRGLTHRAVVEMPLAAKLQLNYMGAVIGTPENAKGLLDEGWLVLTYPEGAKSTARPFAQRDSVLPVEKWGKGWARLALEMDAPVVPVGVVGVEAAIPTVWRSKRLGRAFRLQDDLYPVAPQSPLVGFQPFLTPLLPLPVRCGLSFGPAIVSGERPNDAERLCAFAHGRVQEAIARAKSRTAELKLHDVTHPTPA